MGDVGHNPACIIPAWRDFVGGRSGPLRGVGEPIWPGRSPAELVECQCHEALLNHAFADTDGFHLVCPYDAAHLDRDVIEEAERSHPWVGAAESARYRGADGPPPQLSAPLPDPPGEPAEHAITWETLSGIRALVAEHARQAGVSEQRAGDLVLATHEVATNSIRHGGGEGTLRVWHDDDMVVCEVRDRGRLDQPLAGRCAPGARGRRRLGPVAGQPALRPRPDPHAARRQRRAAAPALALTTRAAPRVVGHALPRRPRLGGARRELDADGFAVTDPLLDDGECAELAGLFDGGRFRSTIDMARHRFGDGRYRYFDHPLPDADRGAARARSTRHLAPVANRWSERLGGDADVPAHPRASCSSAAARPARSARRR